MPEEEVAVVPGVDFDVATRALGMPLSLSLPSACTGCLPCVHLEQRLGRAGQRVDKVVGLRLFGRHYAGKPCDGGNEPAQQCCAPARGRV